MPQDTVWTGDYQNAIETKNNDTAVKQITLQLDPTAVDRIFSNAGLNNNSPYPAFITIIILIGAVAMFRKNKKTGPGAVGQRK